MGDQSLHTSQLEAIWKAREILEQAGVLKSPPFSPQAQVIRLKSILTSPSFDNSSSAQSFLKYLPPSAIPYTPNDILTGRNRTTQQGYVQKFVQHPENVIVEYPETGHSTNEAIAHIFPVSPEESGSFDPKMNIQYGIWGKHGSRDNTRLFLMPQNTKGFTLCKKFKARCM
ncbi:hypothetical protein M422DRAFT_249286 [Sphaerobolus stellatus SS14]|uniref:Uncharacterized protein n=1 Tax=Sphaerobolus stellatus (strain SS14) TaxID=990650 RepID=A0A0C9UVC9_SPHS4|nr:hypothetical protein M422DRAFT_249286 [Sphaerobolus stellatus SS14]